MGILKNARHERFAQNRAKGMSQVQAGINAGLSGASANMSRISNRPDVKMRIQEIQEESKSFQEGVLAARAQALQLDTADPTINVAWLKRELMTNLDEARKAMDFRQANEAIKLLAQITGVLRSGSGGDQRRPRTPLGGDDEDGDDNGGRLSNPGTQVAVQVINRFAERLVDNSGDSSAAKQDAAPERTRPAVPALRHDRAFEAARMLDGVTLEDGEEVLTPVEVEGEE